jgi:CheY-like chemotaxis protein
VHNRPSIGKSYSDGEKLSLIYVDDNHFMLDVMKHFLERDQTVDVQTFLSPKKAISYLKTHNMDLILSDYEMPVMNGAEFLLHLRSQGINIPFILYTSNNHEELSADIFNQDSVHYISKCGPIEQHIARLKDIIQKYDKITKSDSYGNSSTNTDRELITLRTYESGRRGPSLPDDMA